jgi:hypothetical protein
MVSHPKTLSAELYRFPPARAARRSKTHEAYSNRSPLSLWSKHQKIRFHTFKLFEPVHPSFILPYPFILSLSKDAGEERLPRATSKRGGGWNYWNDWNRCLISLFRPLFLIENRAVLGSAALPARTRAKTSTIEFGILQVELDIPILLRIAEDIYRVLPRLDHFELVFQHTPIKYNAFVGKPQRFLGPVCDATLGDPCDHIFAAVVVQQRPLRLAGRVDARHGDIVKGYNFLGFPCVGTGVTGVPKM